MKSTAEYIALLRNYMQKNAEKYGNSRMGIFRGYAPNTKERAVSSLKSRV